MKSIFLMIFIGTLCACESKNVASTTVVEASKIASDQAPKGYLKMAWGMSVNEVLATKSCKFVWISVFPSDAKGTSDLITAFCPYPGVSQAMVPANLTFLDNKFVRIDFNIPVSPGYWTKLKATSAASVKEPLKNKGYGRIGRPKLRTEYALQDINEFDRLLEITSPQSSLKQIYDYLKSNFGPATFDFSSSHLKDLTNADASYNQPVGWETSDGMLAVSAMLTQKPDDENSFALIIYRGKKGI